MSLEEVAIFTAVAPYTLTTQKRVLALLHSIQYIVEQNVEGALVECGVWRGGSILAMILALKELNIDNREIYLYDTFSGATVPEAVDISYSGISALANFQEGQCSAGLEEVQQLLAATDYPQQKIHYIVGPVEETLPKEVPEKIALLRLDTDWYKSTKHELIHLFPVLQPDGVLIVDDYGHWQGARLAIDEYFGIIPNAIMIDYTGLMLIKSREET